MIRVKSLKLFLWATITTGSVMVSAGLRSGEMTNPSKRAESTAIPPMRFARRLHFFIEPNPFMNPIFVYGQKVATVSLSKGRIYAVERNDTFHSDRYPGTHLFVMDMKTRTTIDQVTLSSYAALVAVDDVRNRIYLSSGDRVIILDLKSYSEIGSIPLSYVESIVVDPALGRNYLLSKKDRTIAAVDADSLKVVAEKRIERIGDIGGMALNTRTGILYVTQPTSHNVLLLNARTLETRRTIRFANPRLRGAESPFGVAVSGPMNRVYLCHYSGDNSISILNATSQRMIANVRVAASPYRVIVNERAKQVYVTHAGAFQLTVIDANRQRVIGRVGLVDIADQVFFDPDSPITYVLESGYLHECRQPL